MKALSITSSISNGFLKENIVLYTVMTRQLLNTKILKMNIDNYYKELEGKLLNKVLYCSKNITDIDLQEII